MHFFEKQRVDAAGVLGVKLQKSLIFLGIVSLTAFFFGVFLPSVLSLLILAIGFSGAYRRRPCLLSLYFWINVTIAILGLVFVIAMMVTSTQTPDMGTQSNGYSTEELAVNPIPNPTDSDSPIPSTPYDPSASQSSQQSSESNSFSSSFEYDSTSAAYPVYNLNAVIIIALIVSVVLSVLISFFKVYSIVLAWKMRSLLLAAPTLPVSSKASTPAPSNASYPGYSALSSTPSIELETSIAIPEIPNAQNAQNIQGQVQMMYMPYPYNNNQNGGMMLNQYGQPVFYTYQPMNGFVPQTPQ